MADVIGHDTVIQGEEIIVPGPVDMSRILVPGRYTEGELPGTWDWSPERLYVAKRRRRGGRYYRVFIESDFEIDYDQMVETHDISAIYPEYPRPTPDVPGDFFEADGRLKDTVFADFFHTHPPLDIPPEEETIDYTPPDTEQWEFCRQHTGVRDRSLSEVGRLSPYTFDYREYWIEWLREPGWWEMEGFDTPYDDAKLKLDNYTKDPESTLYLRWDVGLAMTYYDYDVYERVRVPRSPGIATTVALLGFAAASLLCSKPPDSRRQT